MTNTSTKNKVAVLSLDNLTIYNAADLRSLFLSTLAECQHVEVNLASVTEIDCSGLQLMVSLKKSALAQQKNVAFIAHSREVVEFLDLLNMIEFFGDPVMLSKS